MCSPIPYGVDPLADDIGVSGLVDLIVCVTVAVQHVLQQLELILIVHLNRITQASQRLRHMYSKL